MVNEYFKRYDGLPACASTTLYNEDIEEKKQEDKDKMANLEPPLFENNNDENTEIMKDLLKETRTLLFNDSPKNRLQAIIMLFNVCNIFGVLNACVDELLKLLFYDILSEEKTWPLHHITRPKNW